MRKSRILLIWMLALFLTACSSSDDASLPDVQEREREDAINTEQMRKENELLKEQVRNNQKEKDAKEQEDVESLRETLNITFKLMAAMQSDNYTYLESVSSPNIEISQQDNIIISKLEQGDYEVPFLQNVSLNNLEYRGFNPLDSDRVILHMATVWSDGNSALDFYFIRSEKGNWLFDGLLTNG
ncbi:hypothetical protein [Paenibacillus xylanexedens]|uniref:hypothetical protein n=1 Tax=Paenibacillus xylanexedens TaxID=528191 RepID=UPI000F5282A5|nr:hypothetical protein [Paenibacillus xylanexedens]RPK26065.1 hypothetical protein EDO6_04620 [Paenibacillus xylanexedens]